MSIRRTYRETNTKIYILHYKSTLENQKIYFTQYTNFTEMNEYLDHR